MLEVIVRSVTQTASTTAASGTSNSQPIVFVDVFSPSESFFSHEVERGSCVSQHNFNAMTGFSARFTGSRKWNLHRDGATPFKSLFFEDFYTRCGRRGGGRSFIAMTCCGFLPSRCIESEKS